MLCCRASAAAPARSTESPTLPTSGIDVAVLARVVAVVGGSGRGHRRLRVLLLAQVVPDAAALGRAERDLELGEQLRPARLVAAADAVLAREHRGRGDRVVARPRRVARLRGLQVGVQAGGVGVDLLQQLLASRAAEERVLARQLGLGRRARDELARLVVARARRGRRSVPARGSAAGSGRGPRPRPSPRPTSRRRRSCRRRAPRPTSRAGSSGRRAGSPRAWSCRPRRASRA